MTTSTRSIDIEQFRPSFSDQELAELKQSIASARLPAETYASTQESFGITHKWMKEALARWQNGFEWKAYEDKINAVDHYMTTVNDEGHDYKIHFIYHESKDPKAIPLVLLHGWPGSAFEFVEAIKLLRESTEPSFSLIAPMECGYGWSAGPPTDRSFGMADMARIVNKLVTGLGYEKYAVQGGDIGSGVGRLLALNYDSVRALHINYLPANKLPDDTEDGLKEHEVASLHRSEKFQETGRGYAIMHGTRPGTIGIVVGSSPVALLAWLAEKYRDWTDPATAPSVDELLAIATFWWIRDNFANSIWAYHELIARGISALANDQKNYLTKPFGFSSFKNELSAAPEAWAGRNGNLQFYRWHPKGGHFAAGENPEAFAQDMKDCFSKIWPV